MSEEVQIIKKDIKKNRAIRHDYDEKSKFVGLQYIIRKKTGIKFVIDKQEDIIFGKEVEGKLNKLTEKDIELAKKLGEKVYTDIKAASIIYQLFNTYYCHSQDHNNRYIFMFTQSAPCTINKIKLIGLSMVYAQKKYHTDFLINTVHDGIIESDINYENDAIGYANNINLFFCLIKSFDLVNNFIFCQHCGRIVEIHYFDKEERKCVGCQVQDSLFDRKEDHDFCCICQEDVKNIYTLRCGHKFHRACISQLDIKRCPVCRKFVDPDFEDEMFDNISDDFDEPNSDSEVEEDNSATT